MKYRVRTTSFICWSSSILLSTSPTVIGFRIDPASSFATTSKFQSGRTRTLASMASSATLDRSQREGKEMISAPLYITIGPQCCGKTTLLKDIEGLTDVSLDDQSDVYVPIATQQWLNLSKECATSTKDSEKESTTTASEEDQPPELWQQIQGKTIAQRMQNDNAELNLILQRWNGDLSAPDFADLLSQIYRENVRRFSNRNQSNNDGDPNVAQMLTTVVEDFLCKDPQLPQKTDVFCLESLFKPHAKTNESAIQAAHGILKTTPLHLPVAWGNTNSKARDFQQALDIASSTRRPVYFILSHPTAKLEDEKQQLPWVDLSTLLQRNLQRLATAGRYIPANAIADCCRRIQDSLIPLDCQSPWDVEQALVNQSTQPVRRHDKPSPFRYRLTPERLIQKEYFERSRPSQRQYPRHNRQRQLQHPRGRTPHQQQQRRHYRGPPGDDNRRRNLDGRRQYDENNHTRGRRGYNDGRYSRESKNRDEDSDQGQLQRRPGSGEKRPHYSDNDRWRGKTNQSDNTKRKRR